MKYNFQRDSNKARSNQKINPEYDFSKAEKRKFYRPNARFNIPIYLDEDVFNYFSQRAEAKSVDLNDLVNDLLKKDIALIEALELSGAEN
ncbi:MAG: hypothetical protein AAF152_00590 [Cyanobacteria bacterium P01_A01_bin.114]